MIFGFSTISVAQDQEADSSDTTEVAATETDTAAVMEEEPAEEESVEEE